MNEWVQIIVSILSGLAVCIPLVVKLVNAVKAAVEEKNWSKLVSMVLSLMTEAEKQFTEGAARKAWVMGQLEVLAKNVDYPYDDVAKAKVGDMIDAICSASKELNMSK